MLAWRRHAENLAFGGRERDHDEIVLVRSIGCLPLGGEDANDAQGHAFDLDYRTDRTLVGAEQLAGNRLAEDCDERRTDCRPPAKFLAPPGICQLVIGG